MKQLRIIFLTVCVLLAVKGVNAQGAKELKDGILNYLKGEGYAPYIDEADNSVTFKKEGTLYWIDVMDDSAPYYIKFHRVGYETRLNDDFTFMHGAANLVEKNYRMIKVLVNRLSVDYVVEDFITEVSEFKALFELYINILSKSAKMYEESYQQFEKQGFIIGRGVVANVEKDGSQISYFGNPIDSSASKFLKAKLWIYSSQEKTCSLYIKLKTPSGLSQTDSSPSGYTTAITLNLKPGFNAYELRGWGSDFSGRWVAGTYTYEFWYEGAELYSFIFNIK